MDHNKERHPISTHKKHALLFSAALGLALCGCIASPAERRTEADAIAAGVGLMPRVMSAGPFNLAVWEKLKTPGAAADIYIEGDGLAFVSRSDKSPDPTPTNPVALRLAAEDGADNVIYMARPCQYTGLAAGWNKGGLCPDMYWTEGRTAPEVVAAYRQALDDIKAADHVSGFNLTGFSGGGGVAVLVAAGRADILSIRTVAGNIDYAAFNAVHALAPISGSVDPASAAIADAHIPQIHFIGAEDTVVPREVFDGWKAASGSAACVNSVVVDGATHEKIWPEKWAELLKQAPACGTAER